MTDTAQLHRELRQAIDNAQRAADRCHEVCDYLLEVVPHAEMRVALAELQDLRVRQDELVAWVHGADRMPKLTPGAQAIIVTADRRPRT